MPTSRTGSTGAAANITEPFRGIFPTTQVSDRSTFHASLLFALIVYLVVAVILHGIVDWLARRIAGIDRAEEREQMRAALQAQQESTRTALGLDAPATPPTTPAWTDRGGRAGGAGPAPASTGRPQLPADLLTTSGPAAPPARRAAGRPT